MTKGPIITAALIGFAVAWAFVQLQAHNDLSITEMGKCLAAVAIAVVFLKTSVMFLAFRFLNGQRFDGSFFLVATLLAALFVVPLILVASVASRRIEGFPAAELPFLLLGLYGVVVVFLFVAFRLSDRVLGQMAP